MKPIMMESTHTLEISYTVIDKIMGIKRRTDIKVNDKVVAVANIDNYSFSIGAEVTLIKKLKGDWSAINKFGQQLYITDDEIEKK